MIVSAQMRDVLIEHLDGKKVPIRAARSLTNLEKWQTESRYKTVKALLDRRWLRPAGSTYTQITMEGRERLAELLGEYADALTRASDRSDNFGAIATGIALASMLRNSSEDQCAS